MPENNKPSDAAIRAAIRIYCASNYLNADSATIKKAQLSYFQDEIKTYLLRNAAIIDGEFAPVVAERDEFLRDVHSALEIFFEVCMINPKNDSPLLYNSYGERWYRQKEALESLVYANKRYHAALAGEEK